MTTTPPDDVFAFRKTARRRAWICPGAGFAYVGRKRLGALTYLLGLAALLGAIAVVLFPSSWLLTATLTTVVAGTLLWIVELAAVWNAWPAETPPSGRRYVWGAALLASAAVGFAAAMFLSFRLIEINGEGMAPLVWSGDRLLYHTRVDSEKLQRGSVILFGLPAENNFVEPGTLMLGRILALPGDRLSIVDYRYRVNDEVANQLPVATDIPKALEVPQAPRSVTVPEGCYFVIQDDRDDGLDSQTVGYAKRDQIVSTSLFQIDRAPLFARIQ